MQKNVASIQIQKVATFNSGCKMNNQFNSKQIIQKLKPIFIDYYSTHSYVVDISFFKVVFN